MTDRTALFVIGLLMTVMSLALSLWNGEGMLIGTCLLALIISVPVAVFCDRSVYKFYMAASCVLLLCTVITVAVIPADVFVMADRTEWTLVYASALLSGISVAALMVVLFFVTAAAFKASYNWVILIGIGTLTATGMLMIRYLSALFFQKGPILADAMINSVLVVEMMLNIVVFAVLMTVIGFILKRGRLIITSGGLEAMP